MSEQKTTSKKTVVQENSIVNNPSPVENEPVKTGKKKLSLFHAIVSTWSSRKLWMTIFSTMIIYGTYWHSIDHLYTLTRPDQVTALSTMYISMLSVLGVVVAAYLGTNALTTKFGVTGAASLISQSLSEDKTDTTTENKNVNEKIDDTTTQNINFNYLEHIIEEGVNTTDSKPYSKLAISKE